MLRLLHVADVHLGARHPDLGDAASAQRERQLASLVTAVDIALAESVELVLVAGDLFDSNVQPRRTVELAAAELGRLAAARVHAVILPGHHDPDGRASVYRAYDLAAMAGVRHGDDLVTVLTADHPWVHLPSLDVLVIGAVPTGSDAVGDPLDAMALTVAGTLPGSWRIGLAHAAPPAADAATDGPAGSDGRLTEARIAASGLDYLALGHDHRLATGTAGHVTWGVPGSPEQVTVDQDTPGCVLLVSLDIDGAAKRVTVEPRTTGRSRHRELVVDVATVASQAALVTQLRDAADRELVLDVRLTGTRPDALVVEPAEVEEALRTAYVRVRVHDESLPGLTAGELPPADTVAGAFIRSVEGRIAELEATGEDDAEADAAELREVLRLGRRLLAGAEVVA